MFYKCYISLLYVIMDVLYVIISVLLVCYKCTISVISRHKCFISVV